MGKDLLIPHRKKAYLRQLLARRSYYWRLVGKAWITHRQGTDADHGANAMPWDKLKFLLKLRMYISTVQ